MPCSTSPLKKSGWLKKMYKDGDEILYWKRGIPLNRAIFHFGTSEWNAKYELLRQKKEAAFEESLKAAETLHVENNIGKIAKGLLSVFSPPTKANKEFSEHIEILKKDIIRNILNGTLIALGYSLPQNPSSPPHIIPDDVWGKVNWDASEIQGQGLHFVSVRLARRNIAGMDLEHEPRQPKNVPLISPPVAGRLGRPSLKGDIQEAYEYLQSQNLVDLAKPMAAYYVPIREYLAKAYPDKAGQYKKMADETIRLVISSLHKKNKKN